MRPSRSLIASRGSFQPRIQWPLSTQDPMRGSLPLTWLKTVSGRLYLDGGGMVVDGDLEVVFLDQLFEQGEVVVGRLADDDPDAHLAGEVEDLAHARFGPADVHDAVAVERHARLP